MGPRPSSFVASSSSLSSLACVLALVLAPSLAGGCVKRDVAQETIPLTGDLSAYWTCAVKLTSDGRGEDANEGFELVPWFESRAREKGVFEPLGKEDAPESEVTVRLDAQRDGDAMLLRMLLVDTKTKAELGELEASSPITPTATRADALHAAADKILDRLRERRRADMAAAKARPPAPAPAAPLPTTTVGAGAVCSTQCLVPAAATASHDDRYRVAAGADPLLRGLRECLDRVNAQLVVPAVLLRFGPDGRLRHVRVDVGGNEEMECIQGVRATKAIRASTTHATILRCEYRCTSS